ncbi:MAG: biotin--[acetyl-CoA-carboxylase] ligase [Owenweeksia sp.]|nr:biotin--[acetyl-CoA-carboxylase] ligase [Owenweeksia sp.]
MILPPQLQTLFLGKSRVHIDSLGSTNDYLKEMLLENGQLPDGFAVSADYQRSGRGQVGSQWQSEAQKNLLVSVLLRPKNLSADHYFLLNMSVCLAINDTLNFFHDGFLVKWPNDILFDQKKVAGILIENSIAKNRLRQSIVGIGINVNQHQFRGQFGEKISSLARINGQAVDRAYLLAQLFQNLESRYLQLQRLGSSIKDEFLEKLYGYHRQVPVKIEGRLHQAEIQEVGLDGTLYSLINGHIQKFQFKEIEFVL